MSLSHEFEAERLSLYQLSEGCGTQKRCLATRDSVVVVVLGQQVVPFPLFWYRRSATSLGHVTSAALYRDRTRRPYAAELPDAMEPMLRLVQGLQHGIVKARDEQVRSWDGVWYRDIYRGIFFDLNSFGIVRFVGQRIVDFRVKVPD